MFIAIPVHMVDGQEDELIFATAVTHQAVMVEHLLADSLIGPSSGNPLRFGVVMPIRALILLPSFLNLWGHGRCLIAAVVNAVLAITLIFSGWPPATPRAKSYRHALRPQPSGVIASRLHMTSIPRGVLGGHL